MVVGTPAVARVAGYRHGGSRHSHFFVLFFERKIREVGKIVCGSVAFPSVHITNKGGGGAGGSRNSSVENPVIVDPLLSPSGEAKAFGALLDGLEQHGAQLVVSLVGRQVQLVEASMGRWQPVSGPVIPMDLEALDTVHSL